MGIFGRKETQPPKKTYEQVFADLVKNLCEKANNTLPNVRSTSFVTDLLAEHVS